MKAYDLVAAFSSRPATAKPATIYRALEFLAGLGLVHRVECLNAFVACADTTRPHNAAFLICDCCGAAEEHDLGAYAEAKAAADLRGFRLDSVLLEARGRCRDCAQDIDNLRHRA
jgi:Fur family zinc uptake transcriptional regulator